MSGSISTGVVPSINPDHVQDALEAFLKNKDASNVANINITVYNPETQTEEERPVCITISSAITDQTQVAEEATKLIILGMKYQIGGKTSRIDSKKNPNGDVEITRTYTHEYASNKLTDAKKNKTNHEMIGDKGSEVYTKKYKKVSTDVNDWYKNILSKNKPAQAAKPATAPSLKPANFWESLGLKAPKLGESAQV
jgi:hypothetical protein